MVLPQGVEFQSLEFAEDGAMTLNISFHGLNMKKIIDLAQLESYVKKITETEEAIDLGSGAYLEVIQNSRTTYPPPHKKEL